ncbi:hypothetical protein A3Q56_08045, partial [Intoshia linei]
MFLLPDKNKISANLLLDEYRSKCIDVGDTKKVQTCCISDIKPPNFQLRYYNLNIPKRNSKDSMKPWNYPKGKIKRDNDKYYKNRLNEIKNEKKIRKKQDLKTSQITPFTFQKKENFINNHKNNIVSQGIIFNEKYTGPITHDFKNLDESTSNPTNMDTYVQPDPYNLKFLSKKLNIVNISKIIYWKKDCIMSHICKFNPSTRINYKTKYNNLYLEREKYISLDEYS